MRALPFYFILFAYLISGFNIENINAAQNKNLVLTGSSTVTPLAAEIGKKFEEKHSGLRVDVQTGGSSRGIADAKQGLNDIGMVSRALNPDEKDLLAFTIALDGICIILHKQNPINSLSETQIIDIYKGKILNWKEVGGKDAPITVVSKAEGRSTLELFLHHFKLKNSEVKASVLVGDNEQDIKTISGNPNAIGYVSIGTAEFDSSQGVPIKLLPLNDIKPSTETVRNGKFPLSRPLNLVVKSKPEGLIKEFLQFAQSKEVETLVKEQFFVPVAK